MTAERTAELHADMRALPYSEMQRRIALGILSGRVVDGRKRFRRRVLVTHHGGWPTPA